jgi:hypothetical protein
VFLVLDRLQVHRAGQIRDWLAAHRTKHYFGRCQEPGARCRRLL